MGLAAPRDVGKFSFWLSSYGKHIPEGEAPTNPVPHFPPENFMLVKAKKVF